MAAGRMLFEGTVMTPARELPHASVLVEDGRVAWVRPGHHRAAGARRLCAEGDTIVPGFIDLQVNGVRGADAADGREAVTAISRILPRYGVTGFLPTLISRPPEEGARFVAAVAAADAPGARILGAHLEGPFLSPHFRGAHEEHLLRQPTRAHLETVLSRPPKLVTLAPELEGALDAVTALVRADVVVSAGHSGASFAEASAAIDAGVRFGTHIFNAMAPLHHREPGIAGALLADPRVTIGVIPDGVHVHPGIVDTVIRAKGAARVALTTDQNLVAGMPAGRYRFGGMEVESDGTSVYLADGTLAGSASTMDDIVRAAVARPVCSRREAIAMASLVPARALGLERHVGRIGAGAAADLVVLDEAWQVRRTVVAGRIVYEREDN